MKRFLVLCFSSGKPEAILEMINRTLHSGSDLVCPVPFGRSTNGSGIRSVITLLLNINIRPHLEVVQGDSQWHSQCAFLV